MRIRCSGLGADFPRERFMRTPTKVLSKVLQYLESEEQRHANILSASTSMLGVQIAYIAHGMGGGKAPKPKVDLKDFLPFPNWKPLAEEGEPKTGPSPSTKVALARLLRERRIPAYVFSQLNSSPERSQ